MLILEHDPVGDFAGKACRDVEDFLDYFGAGCRGGLVEMHEVWLHAECEGEGPQITMRAPRGTARLMSLGTWNAPYHLLGPSARAMASSAA